MYKIIDWFNSFYIDRLTLFGIDHPPPPPGTICLSLTPRNNLFSLGPPLPAKQLLYNTNKNRTMHIFSCKGIGYKMPKIRNGEYKRDLKNDQFTEFLSKRETSLLHHAFRFTSLQ